MSSLFLHFPPFRLDPSNERLWEETREIPLRPKTFAVLRYLAEHPEQLVTKDELMSAVWSDTVVGDDALAGCIRDLRKVLGDEAKTPRYIETVHRRGYRFIGKVVSDQLSVVSQENEANQKAKGKNQKAKMEEIETGKETEMERENSGQAEGLPPSSPFPIQTLDSRLSNSRLSDLNPQPRRVRPAHQIAAGLMLLVASFLAVRFWFSSTPNPQSLTPNPQPPLGTQHSELGTEPAPQALALPDKPSCRSRT
jgi:DNA-binding winged helix-turn-helix (wHTH) protein